MIASDPTLQQIRRIPGEAGQVSYYVDVRTVGGGTRYFAFCGNIFIGPVLVTSRDADGVWNHEVVDDPRRFGEFVSSQWVLEYLNSWRLEQLADRGHASRWFR